MASNEHTNVKEKEEAKSTPRDARAMKMLLKEMGVEEYEPRVINQMLEFTYRYVTDVLEDARIYCNHASKKEIDADDIKLAVQLRMDNSFTNPPPRDHQQARSVPIIPARSIPHYPMTTSSPAIKITQPIVNVSSDKGLATTGLSPLSLTVKTAQNTLKTTPSLPQASSNIINNPSGVLSVRNSISNQPGTAKAVTQASVATSQTTRQQTFSTLSTITTQASQSITTVSALPSMDETVASSLQQQALVSSLKRKRDGEDDDYDV